MKQERLKQIPGVMPAESADVKLDRRAKGGAHSFADVLQRLHRLSESAPKYIALRVAHSILADCKTDDVSKLKPKYFDTAVGKLDIALADLNTLRSDVAAKTAILIKQKAMAKMAKHPPLRMPWALHFSLRMLHSVLNHDPILCDLFKMLGEDADPIFHTHGRDVALSFMVAIHRHLDRAKGLDDAVLRLVKRRVLRAESLLNASDYNYRHRLRAAIEIEIACELWGTILPKHMSAPSPNGRFLRTPIRGGRWTWVQKK